jgi:hypothetical protein
VIRYQVDPLSGAVVSADAVGGVSGVIRVCWFVCWFVCSFVFGDVPESVFGSNCRLTVAIISALVKFSVTNFISRSEPGLTCVALSNSTTADNAA